MFQTNEPLSAHPENSDKLKHNLGCDSSAVCPTVACVQAELLTHDRLLLRWRSVLKNHIVIGLIGRTGDVWVPTHYGASVCDSNSNRGVAALRP
jgi:hypothetical protein